jgi:hypothetical protein
MSGKLNNITEAAWSLFSDSVTATTEFQAWDDDLCTTEGEIALSNLQQPNWDSFQTVRAVLQSAPGQGVNNKQRTDDVAEIIQNLQPLDDNLLIDLERDFKLHQLQDLPELMDICEYLEKINTTTIKLDYPMGVQWNNHVT